MPESNVVSLIDARTERENAAFDAFTAALTRARDTGTVKDMVRAVRAWEAFVILTVPAGPGRQELLQP